MSDPEDLIARMSRSLEPADREPFQRAAMDAIARMPAALIGPGTVYRAVELTWRGFFRPVDSPTSGMEPWHPHAEFARERRASLRKARPER